MIDRAYAWPLTKPTNNSWAYLPGFFTDAECDQIIAYGCAQPRLAANLGQDRAQNTRIRRNHVCFFSAQESECAWIFERIANGVHSINQQFWRFDLGIIECLQFTIYDTPGDFYAAHQDMGYQSLEQRKLSVSVQLSDPAVYTGSELRLHSRGTEFVSTVRDRGSMIAFPSYAVHEVTPLLSGTRYSLVSWIVGPPYK
jgi:PKHD-type hydroxylase